MINHVFSILSQYIAVSKYKESTQLPVFIADALKTLIKSEEDSDCCILLLYSSVFSDSYWKYDTRVTFDIKDIEFNGNFSTWLDTFLAQDVALRTLLNKATSEELIQLKELKSITDKVAFYISLIVRIVSE